jgi:pectinesterase inhibitor-like protein
MATLSVTISFLALLILHGVFIVDGGSDQVKMVCATTPYQDFCGSALSTAPQNETRNTKEVTYWVLESAYRIGKEACSLGTSLVLLGNLPGEEESCTYSCKDGLKKTITSLSDARDKYPDYDIVIRDVRRSLAMAKKKHIEWDCEKCRKGESKKKVDALSKGNDLGKIMAVLSALVNPVKK